MLLIPGCLTMSKTGSPTQFSPQVTQKRYHILKTVYPLTIPMCILLQARISQQTDNMLPRIALADPRAQQLLKY